ncbi:MAG TPA: 16S rRNA (guanine(966)-N(2))-methyltransferase RsmD [Vicinamibacterales bacterium]|nr:16S rRNA (guanine(966)-N(2))-methyltransferase RsmD [Vicinamibacterales bacterium]
MRIIAGVNKGRTLKAPKWEGLRPTSDKLRGTLFNVLQTRIDGSRVLDMFSGTGAVALEALSRGAASATCVDNDRRATALIAENAALCGESERCVIIRDVASRALQQLLPGGPFDIVVLDPPYDYPNLADAVRDAAAQRATGGLIVLEHASRVAPPEAAGVTLTRTIKSGDSALTFYS